MKEFLVRLISTICLILVTCGAIYFYGREGTFLLASVFSVVVIFEFQKIMFLRYGLLFRSLFIVFAISLLLVLCLPFINIGLRLGIWGLVTVCFLSTFLWYFKGRLNNEQLFKILAFSIFGLFYCSVLPSYILNLILLPQGLPWFSCLLVSSFFGDTFAYLGGRLWGRRKLFEEVSPKKTVEGSLVGLLGSLLGLGLYYYLWFPLDIPLFPFMIIGLLGSVLSQVGDLLMSLIKRLGKVKDSGQIIPGHGGVLDRVDSLILSAPVFFLAAIFYV